MRLTQLQFLLHGKIAFFRGFMGIAHTENQKEHTKIYRDDKISLENIVTVRCMRFHAYGWQKILGL